MKSLQASIRARIVFAVVIVSLLGISAITYVFNINTRKIYMDTLMSQQLNSTRDAAFLISANLVTLKDMVNKTASDLQNMDMQNINGIYTYFNNEEKNISTIGDLYFGRASDGNFVQGINLPLSVGYDPRKRPWYIDAVNAGKLVVTEPYLDDTTNKCCVTIAAPVLQNGTLVGVVGMDIYLDTMQQFIQQVKLGNGGYAFVVDNTGTIIAHPNSALLGLDLAHPDLKQAAKAGLNQYNIASLQSVLQQVNKNGSGALNYNKNNINILGNFASISGFNWKVIFVDNTNDIALKINDISYHTIATGIIALIFICLVIGFITYKGLTSVNDIVTGLKTVGDGDLTVEMKVKSNDEIGQIGIAMNTMLSKFKGTLTNANKVAEKVSNLSEQISTSVKQVAEGSQDQAADLENVVYSVNEISETAKKASSVTKEMVAMANITMNSTDSGQKALENNFRGMRDIFGRVEELGNSAEEINEILDMIKGIAEQTNLLALNAAIEAARAGEQGKGFSVVAEEVRKLAERSTQAASEIGEKVKDIQLNMQTSLDAVTEGDHLGKMAMDSFRIINEKIKDLAAQVEEINHISLSQVGLTDEVAQRIQNISAVTEEISATIQENSSATEELSTDAKEMVSLINQFIL